MLRSSGWLGCIRLSGKGQWIIIKDYTTLFCLPALIALTRHLLIFVHQMINPHPPAQPRSCAHASPRRNDLNEVSPSPRRALKRCDASVTPCATSKIRSRPDAVWQGLCLRLGLVISQTAGEKQQAGYTSLTFYSFEAISWVLNVQHVCLFPTCSHFCVKRSSCCMNNSSFFYQHRPQSCTSLAI